MRLALLLALVPALAAAEDVPLPAPVTDAIIYTTGATLTRRDSADLPAGAHRLLVPLADTDTRLRIALDGATLLATTTAPGALIDGTAFRAPAQQAAQEVVDAARDRLNEAQDAADRAHAAAEAARASLAFWRSVSGAGLTDLAPDTLAATATAVSGGVAAAQTAQVEARAALRAAQEAVDDADAALDQALRDLAATGARPGPVDLLVLDIDAPGGPVSLTLDQDAPGGWTPLYDAILDEAAGRLTLTRRAELRQGSGLPLAGARILLSTADPAAQAAPSPVFPNQAVIREDPPQAPDLLRNRESVALDAAPALAEAGMATPLPDLPVLTYALPGPIDLPATDDPVRLTMGTLDLPVRVFNRAAPRTDAFAYLMAEAADGPPETLLPGPVTLARGESRVGETFLPLTPAGETFEMAFGPRRDLPLDFVRLDNETGERGLFTTSGTRVQEVALRLRNLSNDPETVETLYALPYSEQQALDLSVRADPAPDARDVDDERGVARWDVDLAAGAEARIDIRIEATWPEGQTLVWRP